ncbi:protein of unknown function [Candidatus Hydrogenisulfobacillus filiaventi]|uniref:Uncharacterized protein n=1 Tax=Candidatus Hydrogenisulfobacillus filiaventi TaxID=2707344 RepID=A0A6F8ZKN6_9FIRM|nr:G1 family endopeptidase [Bacillota bacterium]CAB1130172.1 protein of unknown function [Candidatus Hydrogenisulfobacillus filiaventi]
MRGKWLMGAGLVVLSLGIGAALGNAAARWVESRAQTVLPPAPPPSLPLRALSPLAGAEASRNWSGYVAHGQNVEAVQARWRVPVASTPGSVAVWVGIGGVTTRRLLQAGTLTQYGPVGSSTMLWIEGLPRGMEPVLDGLSPGETVRVVIRRTAPGQWAVALAAGGQHHTYTIRYHLPPGPDTAEWVVEDPYRPHQGFVRLTDFSPVQLSGASAVAAPAPGAPEETVVPPGPGTVPILMNRNATILASPHPTGTGSFTVYRTDGSALAGMPAVPTTPLTPVPPAPSWTGGGWRSRLSGGAPAFWDRLYAAWQQAVANLLARVLAWWQRLG